jgi:zinc transport system permease protein
MAGLAALIGAIAVLAGLHASYVWDTPAGPTVVAIAALIFGASNLARAGFRGR